LIGATDFHWRYETNLISDSNTAQMQTLLYANRLYANRRHGLAEEIDRKCECSINIMPNPPKGPYRLHEERQ
jgi:hypothetical protein